MKILSVHKVAKEIGVPVKRWPGACYFIASKMVEHRVVDGKPRYGHWLGPIAKNTMFSKRAIVHHGWIESGDIIIDPTRFVFEGKKPYIHVGPINSDFYDIGGNKFHEAIYGHKPFPSFVDDEKNISVPKMIKNILNDLFGLKSVEKLCLSQLFWLANKPYYELGSYAKMFYGWLIKNDFGALIPIDNRRLILDED